jgi:hypothetical protein
MSPATPGFGGRAGPIRNGGKPCRKVRILVRRCWAPRFVSSGRRRRGPGAGRDQMAFLGRPAARLGAATPRATGLVLAFLGTGAADDGRQGAHLGEVAGPELQLVGGERTNPHTRATKFHRVLQRAKQGGVGELPDAVLASPDAGFAGGQTTSVRGIGHAARSITSLPCRRNRRDSRTCPRDFPGQRQGGDSDEGTDLACHLGVRPPGFPPPWSAQSS